MNNDKHHLIIKDATKVFNKIKDSPHLDKVLSVSNKTPISSVSLDRGLEGKLESKKLIGLVEQYIQKMFGIKDEELLYIPWSKPYIKQTLALFNDIYNSRQS